MGKKLKTESMLDKKKIKGIMKSCKEFFMELVSDLCFKSQGTPEPALIKLLFDIIFIENDDCTQELTPYNDDKFDTIPTIRSFLLQLLLEHRYALLLIRTMHNNFFFF